MGYYSYYTLEVESEAEGFKKDDIILSLISENEEANSALTKNGKTKDEAKWYSSVEDMKFFSKKYPNVLFTLYRRGQEFKDVDKVYFKYGKYKICAASMSSCKLSKQELEIYQAVPANNVLNDECCKVSFTFNSVFEVEHEEIINVINDSRRSYTDAENSLNSWGNFKVDGVWPNYASNLIEFSKKYPDIRFTIQRDIKDEMLISMNDLSSFGTEFFKNGRRHISTSYWFYNDPEKWRS